MNYYPHHIGDYGTTARHLSWDEDCALRRMRDRYFATEKPLPLELKDVWRQVLATTEVQREAVKSVLEEFFEKTDSGWRNADFDAEIDVLREKQQKQRDKANKRWQKTAKESGDASAMPRHEIADAVASPNRCSGNATNTNTNTNTNTKEKREQRSAPKRRIPADWTPSDNLAAWAREKRPDLDVAAVAETFRDYYLAKGEARASWDASFRTWVRKEGAASAHRATRPTSFGALDYSAGIGPNGEIL